MVLEALVQIKALFARRALCMSLDVHDPSLKLFI